MKLKKLVSVAVLSAIGLTGCTTTQEINSEAAQSYAQVVNQAKRKGMIDTTSTTAKRIRGVFNRMVPYAQKENTTGVPFGWQLTVVKSKDLNAWAMPGGKMMFYTGLVDRLKLSNDEIATVMGHEMSHALLEHSKSSRSVGIATGIGNILAQAALGVDLSAVADLGVTKPYSRSHETEADEVGLMLMAKSGYNPSVAPGLWAKMTKVSGDSATSIFSTHPTNSDRQENLQKLLPEAMKLYKASKR